MLLVLLCTIHQFMLYQKQRIIVIILQRNLITCLASEFTSYLAESLLVFQL